MKSIQLGGVPVKTASLQPHRCKLRPKFTGTARYRGTKADRFSLALTIKLGGTASYRTLLVPYG
ncbi:hypothetical protein [Paenibacillus sp. CCS19]|uniref:hypothetical protein n=1 Tax=Paenibacillus sp. CCS19 TaxID=3158387 RepID=UPI00295E9797|nr:hypothetical protein [Paenibacillus cellulosilyticus]